MGHHLFRLARRRVVSLGSLVTCGAVLLNCGGSAGSEDEESLDRSSEENPGDGASGDEALVGAGAVEGIGSEPAECASTFEACGGLLAGTWTVDGTCDPEPRRRSALQTQSWGPEFTKLDGSACSEALGRLTSRWAGTLSFQDGALIDDRRRSDTMEIDLTRECLGSALDADVSDSNIEALCSGFGLESASCRSVEGVCHCTGERLEAVDGSGPYGVLGDMRVAIATPGTTSVVDYCVQEDVLRWQDPETRQVLVLRPEPAAATRSVLPPR
jgi:hypothetical protein